jgi:tetratricopeptide (TPR) repeat protein
MMQTGRVSDGAVDMFATLVEEAIAKHTDTSIEAAVCFYEYGNALFRNALLTNEPEEEEETTTKKHANSLPPTPQERKVATAAAAEARLQVARDGDSQSSSKQPQVITSDENSEEKKGEAQNATNGVVATNNKGDAKPKADDDEQTEEAHTVDEDVALALEMMENAYSIFEEKATSKRNSNNSNKKEWMQRQIPRILQGLGDVLRELNRMADAADAYSRALPYREEFVQDAISKPDQGNAATKTLQHLKDRRLLVEANVLVAEALLGCVHGQHVVTSETKDMLVTADERVDYARGYYDKARDELQETVFLLGTLASAAKSSGGDGDAIMDLGNEKENVCLAATLLMGVGEELAAFDEDTASSNVAIIKDDATGKEPATKKPRVT